MMFITSRLVQRNSEPGQLCIQCTLHPYAQYALAGSDVPLAIDRSYTLSMDLRLNKVS